MAVEIINPDADGSDAFAESMKQNIVILEKRIEAVKELQLMFKNRPQDVLKIIKLLPIINGQIAG